MNCHKLWIVLLLAALPVAAPAQSVIGKVRGIYSEKAPGVLVEGRRAAAKGQWADVDLGSGDKGRVLALVAPEPQVEVGDLVRVLRREPGRAATVRFNVAPLSRPTRVAGIEAKAHTLRALEFDASPVAALPPGLPFLKETDLLGR